MLKVLVRILLKFAGWQMLKRGNRGQDDPASCSLLFSRADSGKCLYPPTNGIADQKVG